MMIKRLYLPSARFLLILALALPSGSPFSRQFSPPASAQALERPSLTDSVETTSVDDLPSAPIYAANASALPANSAGMAPMAFAPVIAQPDTPAVHRFWDRENRVLFATVGAFATADFCATHANLASGGKELNPVTRVLSGSTSGLAANFALETTSIIAISYMFHKTGHHKLERITSFVNIGTSATAVAYDLAHR
jgi:hypothetical protein